MHDGVKIAIDLSLPADLKDGERIPAILRQTRYFRSYDIGWPLSMAGLYFHCLTASTAA